MKDTIKAIFWPRQSSLLGISEANIKHRKKSIERQWLAETECTLLSTFWVIVKFDVCSVKNWARI